MLDDIVTNEMVKPTDCALTSQKLARRPQVFDRGRYAMQAEATVQRMLATLAVTSLELGTFNVITPPTSNATICTASPTDFSCRQVS